VTTSSRHALAPLAKTSADTPDPLLELLQRYEAERAAFDQEGDTERIDQDWDRIAEETWSRTQDEILAHPPPATTAAGALLALDHVLRDDEVLFGEREECADQQMLWLLIKAARDYIATVDSLDNEK
jgi:hypothetical protein